MNSNSAWNIQTKYNSRNQETSFTADDLFAGKAEQWTKTGPSILAFLFIFPSSGNNYYVVASNGGRILYEGYKTKQAILRDYPVDSTVQCNTYNIVAQGFKNYPQISLAGTGVSASLEEVRSHLIFPTNERRKITPETGYVAQDTLLMFIMDGKIPYLIDNKGKRKPVGDANGFFETSIIESHKNLVLVSPDAICPFSRQVMIDPDYCGSIGQVINMWTMLKANSTPLFSLLDVSIMPTNSAIKASVAVSWIRFGSALSGELIGIDDAYVALGNPSPRDLVEMPPKMPEQKSNLHPIAKEVHKLLAKEKEKTMSTQVLLQKINWQFILNLTINDFIYLINSFGGVSAGIDQTTLLWND